MSTLGVIGVSLLGGLILVVGILDYIQMAKQDRECTCKYRVYDHERKWHS